MALAIFSCALGFVDGDVNAGLIGNAVEEPPAAPEIRRDEFR